MCFQAKRSSLTWSFSTRAQDVYQNTKSRGSRFESHPSPGIEPAEDEDGRAEQHQGGEKDDDGDDGERVTVGTDLVKRHKEIVIEYFAEFCYKVGRHFVLPYYYFTLN